MYGRDPDELARRERKLHEAIPPEPAGLAKALMTDVSPLRPWELYEVDAYEWERAQAFQAAYREGAQSYQQGKAKQQEGGAKLESSRRDLLKQVHG